MKEFISGFLLIMVMINPLSMRKILGEENQQEQPIRAGEERER